MPRLSKVRPRSGELYKSGYIRSEIEAKEKKGKAEEEKKKSLEAIKALRTQRQQAKNASQYQSEKKNASASRKHSAGESSNNGDKDEVAEPRKSSCPPKNGAKKQKIEDPSGDTDMREAEYAKPGTNAEALKLSKARRNALKAKGTFAARRLQSTENIVKPGPTSSGGSILARTKRAHSDRDTEERRQPKKLADERRASDVESKMLNGKALKGKAVKTIARLAGNRPASRRSSSDSNVSKGSSDTTLSHSTSSNSTAATTPPKSSPEADIFAKEARSELANDAHHAKAAEEIFRFSKNAAQADRPVRAAEESAQGSADPVEPPSQLAVDDPNQGDNASPKEADTLRDDEPSTAPVEATAAVASSFRLVEADIDKPNLCPNGVGLLNPQNGCFAIAVLQYIFRTISPRALRTELRELLEMDEIEVPEDMDDLRLLVARKNAVKALVELLEEMTTIAETAVQNNGTGIADTRPFLCAFGETQKRLNTGEDKDKKKWIIDWDGSKQQDACEFYELLMGILEDKAATRSDKSKPLVAPFISAAETKQECRTCENVVHTPATNWTVPVPIREQDDNGVYKLSELIAKRERKGCGDEDCPLGSGADQLGHTKISTAPPYLVINLNRAYIEDGALLKARLEVELDDILSIPSGTSVANYRLQGFIKHLGWQMERGHYISYWRPAVNGKNPTNDCIVCDDDEIDSMPWDVARATKKARKNPDPVIAFYFRV